MKTAPPGGPHGPKLSLENVDKIIKKYDGRRSSLIAMLFDVQESYKYLPRPALEHLAQKLNVPLIQLYSIATFYKAFTLTPRGRHQLTICLGTACHVRGAVSVLEEIERQIKIKPGQTSGDGEWSLTTVNCLGSCALGPIVVQDETGKYHSKVTPSKVSGIISGVKSPAK